MKKLTTEEFISKARLIHGDKYDYSKVIYVGNKTKVCIICSVHGEFKQTPDNHIHKTLKQGCPLCSHQSYPDTTESFIKKAIEVYENEYDYSKVVYIDNQTKVCIICPIHGEFYKAPVKFLNRKQGCKECTKLNMRLKMSHTIDKFIEKAVKIHGNKYDYSKVNYVNSNVKICIVCPIHGEFWQLPSNHIHKILKQGCTECGFIEQIRRRTSTKNEFVEKAVKIHGLKYDYSKVMYEKSYKKISIICPEHGEFTQTPSHHIQGCGCPHCRESRLEREINKFLEGNNINFERQKRFEWLGRQSLDFYLAEYNIAIECQGKQHFEPVKQFGGENGLMVTQERDQKKMKLCQENNVKINYISYNEENKFELIKNIIKNV